MNFDFTITGGIVVDGTGSPRRSADVALLGDKIAAIGPGPFAAAETIDATGCIVAPGFIDLHSHADFTLLGRPGAETQLAQGVTTLVTGNCGQSPFPVPAGHSGAAWSDAYGFGDAIAAARPAVNVGLQLGHNALRVAVLGSDDRAPTTSELEQMCTIITESASAPGVVGFSTGLIYIPGLFAQSDELHTLVAAAARAGLLYSTHMRDETSELTSAVEEAIDTAEAAGARLQISHLKAMGPENWGSVHLALELIDQARLRGVDVTADVYPYTASSTDLSSRLAKWAVDGGLPALLQRLEDPEIRMQIADELRSRFGRDIDPDGVVIAAISEGEFHRYIGYSLAEIGAERGTDAADAALDVLAAQQGSVSIVNHAMSEDDMQAVLTHPSVSVASDGWMLAPDGPARPHPRSFGTFARVLGRYVRDEHTLTLEDAIRKMTSLPASRIRAADRGTLAPAFAADVVVLDPDRIEDTSTFDSPWQLARGARAVFVNGVPAVIDGDFTGRHSGRLLKRTKA